VEELATSFKTSAPPKRPPPSSWTLEAAFITTVIAFIVIALVVYWISKPLIREPTPAEVKTCPACKESNAVDATRCRACTSAI